MGAYRAGPLLRRKAGRSHYLIEFADQPGAEQTEKLRRRGVAVMSYVPDRAMVVAASDDSKWDGLGLRFVGRLDAMDKLSAALSSDQAPDGGGGNYVVVEFQPDADMSEARALVAERGLRVENRANMPPTQLLVDGSLADTTRLADWDEVAYIFPASSELVGNEIVYVCPGPITEQGPIAQYALASPGWTQTGTAGSPISLGYFFGQLTQRIPTATAQSEILRALSQWSSNANVTFSPAQTATDPRTLYIFFASGAHGDAYPFTDSTVLAHTFYPAPPNSEPAAGDMHFNADENWQVGSGTDLFSVALHEAGHALGLAHTDNPSSVMYPYYRFNTALSADDIAGAVSLYGAPGTGGGAPSALPTTPAPTIAITNPAANTSTAATTISLAGTASGGSVALSVAWSSDHGGSGMALGAANWLVLSAPLAAGVNRFTVTVTDSAGKTAAQSIAVTGTTGAPASTPVGPTPPALPVTPAPPTIPSGTADTTPPSVQILSPSQTILQTPDSTVTLSGIASDNVGVTSVKWANSFGQGGAAQGTTSWQIPSIPVLVGTNRITVSAYDAAGNAGTRVITVVRMLD